MSSMVVVPASNQRYADGKRESRTLLNRHDLMSRLSTQLVAKD